MYDGLLIGFLDGDVQHSLFVNLTLVATFPTHIRRNTALHVATIACALVDVEAR